MPKRGILIFPIFVDINRLDGIIIKNEGIEKAFRVNGVETDTIYFKTDGVYCGKEKIAGFSSNKYIRYMQMYSTIWPKIARFICRGKYDFMWARLLLISPWQANFIKYIKEHSSCQTIIEYGAYPFVDELTPNQLRWYKLNRGYEKKMHRFTDFIITWSGQTELDGVTVIPIDNGIDPERIKAVHPTPDVDTEVRLISVSSLRKWHAVERLVAGIPAYLQKKSGPRLRVNVVGTGPEFDKVKKLSDSLGLQDVVSFSGLLGGQKLDDAYQNSHVAIGTLGFHRIGITNSSSLKNREYFARGMPVALSTPDKDMPAELPFVLYVSQGEDPVDVSEIVAFAQRAYKLGNVNDMVRQYAEGKVSWNSKIQTVISYLDSKQ